MSIQQIPVIGRLFESIDEKRTEREKANLRKRGLSPQRAEERPFKDWSDHRLRHESHRLTMRIRSADSGFGLSPLVDRGALMVEELRRRGLEDTIPTARQLEQIEAYLAKETDQ